MTVSKWHSAVQEVRLSLYWFESSFVFGLWVLSWRVGSECRTNWPYVQLYEQIWDVYHQVTSGEDLKNQDICRSSFTSYFLAIIDYCYWIYCVCLLQIFPVSGPSIWTTKKMTTWLPNGLKVLTGLYPLHIIMIINVSVNTQLFLPGSAGCC